MFNKNDNKETTKPEPKQKRTYTIQVILKFKNREETGITWSELSIRRKNELLDRFSIRIAEAVSKGKYCQLDETVGFRGEEVISYGVYAKETKV